MRHCVGEDAGCNGPDCGHAEDCPYYLEYMKEDSSLRDELERRNRPRKEKAMESNVQKMQKALDKIIVITTEWQGSIPFGEVRKIAKAARKLPLRNCDVGTAEEQRARYDKFCDIHDCRSDCPLFEADSCELAWAQMPYEPDAEKEGAEE